jgi:hypothetical protein
MGIDDFTVDGVTGDPRVRALAHASVDALREGVDAVLR